MPSRSRPWPRRGGPGAASRRGCSGRIIGASSRATVSWPHDGTLPPRRVRSRLPPRRGGACSRASPSRSAPARRSSSRAATAPASRRCSRPSPACSRRKRARSPSRAAASRILPRCVHLVGHRDGLKAPLTPRREPRLRAPPASADPRLAPADGPRARRARRRGRAAGRLSVGRPAPAASALARLLVAARPLWLLDEPTTRARRRRRRAARRPDGASIGPAAAAIVAATHAPARPCRGAANADARPRLPRARTRRRMSAFWRLVRRDLVLAAPDRRLGRARARLLPDGRGADPVRARARPQAAVADRPGDPVDRARCSRRWSGSTGCSRPTRRTARSTCCASPARRSKSLVLAKVARALADDGPAARARLAALRAAAGDGAGSAMAASRRCAARRHARPDLRGRDRGGADREPPARRADPRDPGRAADGADADLRRRGRRSGSATAARPASPDPRRPHARDRRRRHARRPRRRSRRGE